jgi:hypothetical protein
MVNGVSLVATHPKDLLITPVTVKGEPQIPDVESELNTIHKAR